MDGKLLPEPRVMFPFLTCRQDPSFSPAQRDVLLSSTLSGGGAGNSTFTLLLAFGHEEPRLQLTDEQIFLFFLKIKPN